MDANDYKNARKVLKDGLWASAVYLEALEKQIPKKAQKEVKIDGDYYFCCPTCERPIASKFCPDCGQAILEGEQE